ncbi:hypothetical protein C8Q77DRAFT_1207248 [Trametes polyzona]|nr:hypothetical protein C8Q77DRAFT_1207248 [Trametes polyzona]
MEHNQAHPIEYNAESDAGASQESAWTAEACLAAYEAANDQYWREHGLSMAHASFTNQASAPAAPTGSSAGCAAANTPYEVLPQRVYIAKRRFEPKPPVAFRTWSKPYLKLADALAGNVAALQGREDGVFSEDHLSQKQSLRLEIVESRSYERQINVRSPANSFRSITRGKLAEKIAREIFEYLNRCQRVSYGPPGLTLGPGTAGFERLVLLELRHVSKSSWQPVLGVLGNPEPGPRVSSTLR